MPKLHHPDYTRLSLVPIYSQESAVHIPRFISLLHWNMRVGSYH